jgi:hypothetical protein
MVKRKIALIYVGWFVLLMIAGPVFAQEETRLADVVVQKDQNQLEARLVIIGSVNYESFTLFNPNRLVIDLLQIKEFSNPEEIAVDDFGVIRIRTAKNRPDVIRVVFDLDETVPSYSIEDREGAIHVFFRLERPAAEKPVEKKAEAEPVQKTAPTKAKPKPPVKTEPRQERRPAPAARGNALSIGLGGGLYFTQSSDFQDIYDKNSSFFGLAVTFYKSISAVENLGFTLEGDYITDSGFTTYTEEEVKLTMTPVILDIFYQRYFGRFAPFAGLGGSYFSYKEELPETFPVPEVTGSILGYNFLVGTHIQLIEQLSIRAYLRYHVAKKTEEAGNEVDLSGSELGIGLSYFFNF